MATGGPSTTPPQTHSLEFTSALCTLGENGTKWRTPTPEYHADVDDAHRIQSQAPTATVGSGGEFDHPETQGGES